METLDDKILEFLSVSSGSGSGSGYGSGYGYGYGYGYGSDDGDGDGDGDGYGDGYGDGSGSGYGSGYGSGSGEVNGKKIYLIDGIYTIIDDVRGNVAVGDIFGSDFSFTPCYVVKENDKFAHGRTLHEAFAALQEKLFDNSTEEERLSAFKNKFPDYDTPYSNTDLYAYHHVLTGSCRMGRDTFAKQHGISMDGKMTVRQFVELTKEAYGGDIIKKIPERYGE